MSIKTFVRSLIPHHAIVADPKKFSRPVVVHASPTTSPAPSPVIVRDAPSPMPRRRAPPAFDPTTESEPIHVSATVVLQPGATQAPNAIALANPNGSPMEIYEISITINEDTSGTSGAIALITGAAIGLKLDLGNFPITKDFVPVNLLGPARNLFGESGGPQSAFGSTLQSYTWRLPCPIFVPAGAVMVPQLQHRNLTTDSIIVTIGYSGRSLAHGARPPKKVRLPYAASWVSKGFNTFGAADADQSAETDLVNLLTQPLKVLYFVGRVNTVATISGNRASSSLIPADFAARLLTARIADSYGHGLVPIAAPFGQIFSPQTALFPAAYTLESGAHVRAFLSKTVPTIQASNIYTSQAMISMIGVREVEG